VSFFLGKFLGWITDPGIWLILLLLGASLGSFRRRGRGGRGLLLAATLLSLALAVLPFGAWLLLPLENRFPAPASLPDHIDGILVLGGALDGEASAARGQPVLNDSGERLTAAVTLARAHPEARLIFSGGSSSVWPDQEPEARYAERLLLDLGVPPDQLAIEGAARTTRENAAALTALLGAQAQGNWVLITSAWHMPRAVGCFRQLGWRVIPYPVDYRTEGKGEPLRPLALAAGIADLSVALHEWLGLLAYRIQGATDALLPAP
jgi:uncharacterized SAM-binding protein YcdF (DUF218 family)